MGKKSFQSFRLTGELLERRTLLAAAGFALGYFNNDSKIDLVTVPISGTKASVMYGRGDGTFQGAHFVEIGGQGLAVAIGDVNGDGQTTSLSLASERNPSVSY